MTTTLVLTRHPWFQAIGMGFAWFLLPMLVAVALAFKKFQPGRRAKVILLGLILSSFLAYTFSNVHTALVLSGDNVTVRYLTRGVTSLKSAEIRSVEISRIRGGGEVLLVTMQDKGREVISVDSTLRAETAKQLAVFVGLKQVPGTQRWER